MVKKRIRVRSGEKGESKQRCGCFQYLKCWI